MNIEIRPILINKDNLYLIDKLPARMNGCEVFLYFKRHSSQDYILTIMDYIDDKPIYGLTKIGKHIEPEIDLKNLIISGKIEAFCFTDKIEQNYKNNLIKTDTIKYFFQEYQINNNDKYQEIDLIL